MSTGWVFPPSHGGERTGFRDAGIALFSTDAVRSMTREVLQNCIDAALDRPVRVTFTRERLQAIDLPNWAELRAHVQRCSDDAKRRFHPVRGEPWTENGGAAAELALAMLDSGRVPVLRIRDENTKGLSGAERGAETEDSDWDRLIRKKGSPQYHGAGGGSFGVGQRAPYAAATLRTLFYGTNTGNDFAFIGKSIWWSVPIPNSVPADHTQNVGYWGRHDASQERVIPVTDRAQLQPFFRRETRGTDLFLLGFESERQVGGPWHASIIDAVLINYFAAIQAGRLEVILDGGDGEPARVEISTRTLEGVLEQRIRTTAPPVGGRKKGETHDDLRRTESFLAALTKGKRHDGKGARLGQMRLHVIQVDKGPNRIAWMRSPLMLVSSSGNNTLRDYAAVFVCEDERGNGLLRTLEGPEHNHWDNKTPQRAEIIRERNEFIRSVLEKLAGLDNIKEQDVPDLAAYLPEELPSSGTGTGPVNVTERRQPKETGKSHPRVGRPGVSLGRVPPAIQARVTSEEPQANQGEGPDGATGKGGGRHGGNGNTTGGPNPGPGTGDLGDPGGTLPRLKPRDISYRSWFDATGLCVLLLRTGRSGEADIEIRALGADGPPASVRVVTARDLATGRDVTVTEGRLRQLLLTQGSPLKLVLKLMPERRAALNVEVIE